MIARVNQHAQADERFFEIGEVHTILLFPPVQRVGHGDIMGEMSVMVIQQ